MWKSISVIILMNGLKIEWGKMSSSKSGNIAFPILFTTTPVVVSVNMRTDNSSLYYSQIARAKNNQYFTIPSSSQCDWFAIGF